MRHVAVPVFFQVHAPRGSAGGGMVPARGPVWAHQRQNERTGTYDPIDFRAQKTMARQNIANRSVFLT